MTQTATGLDPAQVATFNEQGYLLVEDVVPHAALDAVIAEINYEVTTRADKLVAAGKLSRSYAERGFEQQLIAIDQEDHSLVAEVSSGALSGTAMFELIRHPALIDMAESLCGPELIASSVYRLRPKVPSDPRGEVPWHQDSSYFATSCDGGLIVTMWIPLIDASVENGCLYVLPRAHNCDLLRHTPNEAGTYLAIGTNDLPPVEPVPIPVRKGGVLLMTNRTPHASFENTTDRVRWSMDLRYQSATLPTNADITAPTSDEAAAVPAACYPPAKDFLVRSRKHPDDMVSDAQVFHDLRARHRAEYDAGFAKSAPGSEKRRINPFSLERWQ